MGFVTEEVDVLDWRDWRRATTMDTANQHGQDRYLAIQSLIPRAQLLAEGARLDAQN